jgi:predicted nucleic acid-binding Zn finger protein
MYEQECCLLAISSPSPPTASRHIAQEDTLILHHLCGSTDIEVALEAVDKRRVSLVGAKKSHRTAYCFEMAQTRTLIYLEPLYCSCASFANTLAVNQVPFCKHLLAALLANALGTVERVTVTDADFASKILGRE